MAASRPCSRSPKGAGKKPGEEINSGFDISSAAMQGSRTATSRWCSTNSPTCRASCPSSRQCSQKKYGIAGLNLNTGGGTLTKDNAKLSRAGRNGIR